MGAVAFSHNTSQPLMKRQIDQEIGAFIANYIDSVHTLEVLLMLLREPARAWTTDDIHERVQSSPAAVKASLLSLTAANLARQSDDNDERFLFSTPSNEHENALRKLAELYEVRRTLVIEYLYSRPARKTEK